MVILEHDLLHHLLGHRNWAFCGLWLGVSTVFSSIGGRICGMRTSTSSVCGLAWGTTIAMVSQPMSPLPCDTFISRGMLLWAHWLCLWCSLCERTRPGCAVGIDPDLSERCSHPGCVRGCGLRDALRTWTRLLVVVLWFCGFVLSYIRTFFSLFTPLYLLFFSLCLFLFILPLTFFHVFLNKFSFCVIPFHPFDSRHGCVHVEPHR